ncbi:quercetin 2,3-dioxygenase [Bryobacterales bacterium F-183]|nr:quercetin 2,3-dioxygenase [Bryobacterales bacterium F-183]
MDLDTSLLHQTGMMMEILPHGASYWVGDGFPVRNLFPSNGLGNARLSPFLLLDYAGPARFEPSEKPRGVEVHPHRGFETVTIAYQGSVAHRDSSGASGVIRPGDVQWMTAASGVVHEEMHDPEFSRAGGDFEMIQLWVNLPKADKMSPPKYQTLESSKIPVLPFGAQGFLRVIAGDYEGNQGAATTFTPVGVYDVELQAGDQDTLTLNPAYNTMLFLRSGEVTLNGEQKFAGEAMLALVPRGVSEVKIEAGKASKFVVLTGEPIDEPVAQHGPFVMNTREELVQAFRDFQSGKMGQLPTKG